MNWTHIALGAAAGLVLGIAATLIVTTAMPGNPRTVEDEAAAATPTTAVAKTRAAPAPVPDRPTEITIVPTQVQSYIQSLEDKVDELEMQNTLITAQLAGTGGQALAWPPDIAAAFQDEGFREAIQKAAEADDGVELADVDCSEYPCMAYFEIADPEQGMHERIKGVTGALQEGLGGEDAGIMAMAMHEKNDDGPGTAVLALAAFPKSEEGGPPPQDMHARTQARAEDWVADHAAEVSDEPSP